MKKLLIILLLIGCKPKEFNPNDIYGLWTLDYAEGLCERIEGGETWNFKTNGVLVITDSVETKYKWSFSDEGEMYPEGEEYPVYVPLHPNGDTFLIRWVDDHELHLKANCNHYYFYR